MFDDLVVEPEVLEENYTNDPDDILEPVMEEDQCASGNCEGCHSHCP